MERDRSVGFSGLVRRILLAVFLFSLVGGVGGFYLLLRDEAMEDAEKEARNLMAFARAVREYTSEHVTPLLAGANDRVFHEATVPSFASRKVFERAGGTAKNYTFRQPTLNPTSPEDQPTSAEMEILNRFRAEPGLRELTGVLATAQGQTLYLAEPVRISDAACLECHSTPERAPAAMVAKYGPHGGFGWKLGDTVGAVVLTVPLTEQLKGVIGIAGVLALGLSVVFVAAYFAMATALDRALIRPLNALAEAADTASRSGAAQVALPDDGVAEVARLAGAIGRLRLSLGKAMDRLAGQPGQGDRPAGPHGQGDRPAGPHGPDGPDARA